MLAGIYCFFNVRNKKSYVGQSINIESRVGQHYASKDGEFHKDLQENPNDFVVFYPWCYIYTDKKDLAESFRRIFRNTTYLLAGEEDDNKIISFVLDYLEQVYIDLFNSFVFGYNKNLGGQRGNTGDRIFNPFGLFYYELLPLYDETVEVKIIDGEDEKTLVTNKLLRNIKSKDIGCPYPIYRLTQNMYYQQYGFILPYYAKDKVYQVTIFNNPKIESFYSNRNTQIEFLYPIFQKRIFPQVSNEAHPWSYVPRQPYFLEKSHLPLQKERPSDRNFVIKDRHTFIYDMVNYPIISLDSVIPINIELPRIQRGLPFGKFYPNHMKKIQLKNWLAISESILDIYPNNKDEEIFKEHFLTEGIVSNDILLSNKKIIKEYPEEFSVIFNEYTKQQKKWFNKKFSDIIPADRNKL